MQDQLNKDHIRVEGNIISITLPLKVQRWGRKNFISVPKYPQLSNHRAVSDNTLIKALAHAWQWQKMLDEGKYRSIRELAITEGFNLTCVMRLMKLNTLSPFIKQMILDCTQQHMISHYVRKSIPELWSDQHEYFGLSDKLNTGETKPI